MALDHALTLFSCSIVLILSRILINIESIFILCLSYTLPHHVDPRRLSLRYRRRLLPSLHLVPVATKAWRSYRKMSQPVDSSSNSSFPLVCHQGPIICVSVASLPLFSSPVEMIPVPPFNFFIALPRRPQCRRVRHHRPFRRAFHRLSLR